MAEATQNGLAFNWGNCSFVVVYDMHGFAKDFCERN
jgi:hypothetical protein